MTFTLAVLGLVVTLCFARSIRAGFSGTIGTYLSLLQIPAVIAATWALFLVVGWWAVAAFLAASVLAGLVVNQRNVGHWVIAQPLAGTIGAALSFCSLALAW